MQPQMPQIKEPQMPQIKICVICETGLFCGLSAQSAVARGEDNNERQDSSQL